MDYDLKEKQNSMKYNPKMALSIRGTCTHAGTDQISAYRGTCTQAGTNQISAYRTRLHDVFTLTESSGFLTMPGLLSHRLTYICRKPLSSFFFPPEPVVTPPSISSFNLQQKVPHKLQWISPDAETQPKECHLRS